MKKLILSSLIITALLFTISSCKKTGFITSGDALLRTSVDTLHYDTVFTSFGSITQSFKIFNVNDQKLKLSNVQLMGGSASFFKLNVDGLAGTSFSDIEIDANDSIYVFVNVTINPNTANLAFLVQDSIRIQYNGNTRYVQLDAFGQNARFMRSKRVTTDSLWKNDLPVVILGSLSVDANKTLTIQKGTKIYFHADAPMIVNGTLKAIGNRWDSTKIKFAGDRLDAPYKDFPGSYPGIVFSSSSKDNLLQFCNIINAYQGVVVQSPSTNANPKLTLNECIFDNIYDVAIGGLNSSITARNCLVTNAGSNVALYGGSYSFNHCTFSSYGNTYVSHKKPVFTASNTDGTTAYTFNCQVKNSIIYGEGGIVDDEIATNKQGTGTFTLTFDNVLYKVKNTDPANAVFSGTILKNVQPQFDTINVSNRYFNWRLRSTSPCINKATASGVLYDLDSNLRTLGIAPDLGCYEKQ